MALYFAPEPKKDPEVVLASLLKGKFEEGSDRIDVTHEWLTYDEYPHPSGGNFQYFSVGLDPKDDQAIGKSKRVFLLSFLCERRGIVGTNKTICALVNDLASQTGGIPWDEEVRLLYSSEAWNAKRVDSWEGSLPDMSEHINMHAYRDPELIRIVTLGMRKFNLPDIAISEVIGGSSIAAGNTINVIMQALVEGQYPEDDRLQLVLGSLKHKAARAKALENPGENAEGEVMIQLDFIDSEEGDPANLLLDLTFPEVDAETRAERQGIAFDKLYGSTSDVQGIQSGDPDMQAASKKARVDFLKLEDHFNQGLQPNERILVKHGFNVGEGLEYMWVELLRWKNNEIEGVLLNDSYYDSKLRSGKRVSFKSAEVFDYIHQKPDGTEAGNETGKVLDSKR